MFLKIQTEELISKCNSESKEAKLQFIRYLNQIPNLVYDHIFGYLMEVLMKSMQGVKILADYPSSNLQHLNSFLSYSYEIELLPRKIQSKKKKNCMEGK